MVTEIETIICQMMKWVCQPKPQDICVCVISNLIYCFASAISSHEGELSVLIKQNHYHRESREAIHCIEMFWSNLSKLNSQM